MTRIATLLVLLVLLALLSFFAGCETWKAGVTQPIDFYRPTGDVPANFTAEVGGKF